MKSSDEAASWSISEKRAWHYDSYPPERKYLERLCGVLANALSILQGCIRSRSITIVYDAVENVCVEFTLDDGGDRWVLTINHAIICA